MAAGDKSSLYLEIGLVRDEQLGVTDLRSQQALALDVEVVHFELEAHFPRCLDHLEVEILGGDAGGLTESLLIFRQVMSTLDGVEQEPRDAIKLYLAYLSRDQFQDDLLLLLRIQLNLERFLLQQAFALNLLAILIHIRVVDGNLLDIQLEASEPVLHHKLDVEWLILEYFPWLLLNQLTSLVGGLRVIDSQLRDFIDAQLGHLQIKQARFFDAVS